MYNRYRPQPDGSFRRDQMQEKHPPAPPQEAPKPEPHRPPPREEPVSNFLKQLLPSSFDTGDLFIVLLLLLMAGDSDEGRGNALLTLALYFIM